jgi:hypothetical protein
MEVTAKPHASATLPVGWSVRYSLKGGCVDPGGSMEVWDWEKFLGTSENEYTCMYRMAA